jgi:uncharacterized integral membrane protein (TIGR00698 family)
VKDGKAPSMTARSASLWIHRAAGWVRARIGGLLLVLAVAAFARVSGAFLPRTVPEVLVAIGAGLLVANVARVPVSFKPGIAFAAQKLLRAGIILLGARLSLGDVQDIGARSIGLIVLLMALALAFAVGVGRLLKLPPRLALLIGVGTAVCGNTAIVATAPVVGAEEREVGFAVATITLLGTLAVLLYPLIGASLALSQDAFGIWAGVAVNDTSQVVAASSAYGPAALDVATVVKLTRNALMAPLLVGIALFIHWGAGAAKKGVWSAVPLFVLGFLALALLRTLDLLDPGVVAVCDAASKLLVLCALAGVGLSTVVTQLRQTGPKPFLLGLATTALVASVGLWAVTTFFPGSTP